MTHAIKYSLFFLISIFVLLGCEDKDKSAIFEAQKCLDDLPLGEFAGASVCYEKVQNITTQQAFIVRCSAKLIQGGLTESKFATAFDSYEKNSEKASNELDLLLLLSLNDSGSSPNDLSLATAAQSECSQTGLKGHEFISSVALAGTMLKSLSIPNGTDITGDTLPAITASIEAQIDSCVNDADGPGCNKVEMEAAITAIAASQCSNASSDSELCSDIDNAIASGTLFETFLCQIQDKSPNAGSCQ